MSLKDKSRTSAEIAQAAKRNVLNRSSVTTTTNERWVKLSDAEEEINHIEDVWVAVNNGKTLVIKEQGEEIETLVDLLRHTLPYIKDNLDLLGYDLILKEQITQTLKKYE